MCLLHVPPQILLECEPPATIFNCAMIGVVMLRDATVTLTVIYVSEIMRSIKSIIILDLINDIPDLYSNLYKK